MRARLRALRPVARLARRDAARHRTRTISAILLIALPVALIVGLLGLVAAHSSVAPTRRAALNTIPDGIRAVVTGTAVNPLAAPLQQRPEGLHSWIDDPDVVPADAQVIGDIVPAEDEVHQFWTSGTVLATTGGGSKPGAVDAAGAGSLPPGGGDLQRVATTALTEADSAALDLLLPAGGPLVRGTAPVTTEDLVITTAVAARTGADVGDEITLIAPPFTGWYSTDGRIREFLANTQRGFRVSGIVEAEEDAAWALPDWVAGTARADPAGVDTHFLITGPQPVSWEEVKELNEHMAMAVSRDVLTNYPPDAELYPAQADPASVVLYIVLLALAAAGAVGLLLGLVTPAFAVAAEQQRHTLALTAATGARPRDLRRTLTLQGAGTGVAGGLLGCLLGAVGATAVVRLVMHRDDPAAPSWWMVVLAVVLCAGAGWFATAIPARRVARGEIVVSLRRRSAAVSSPQWVWRGGALVAFAVAVGCAIASLRAPLPRLLPEESHGVSGPGGAVVALLSGSLLAAAVGLLLAIPVLVRAVASCAHRAPLALRLALREAGARMTRSAPVVGAVAVAVAVLGAGSIILPSQAQNSEDYMTSLVGPGNLAIGPKVPISSDFDAAFMESQAAALAEAGLPVTGALPVYSGDPRDGGAHLTALPAPGKACPGEYELPSTGSVLGRSGLECVDWNRGHQDGQMLPWWLGDAILIMEPDTMRATRFPDAERAAETLEAGGVVVADATRIAADGTVTLEWTGQDGQVIDQVSLPGLHLPRLAAEAVMTPRTAAELWRDGEQPPIYVGAILETSRDLTPVEVERAKEILAQDTDLVMVAAGADAEASPWGGPTGLAGFGAAVLFALCALAVSLALVRSQALPDLVTMHALGARAAFLRRTAAAHAAVVLGLGVPLGALIGWAGGAYAMAWRRRIYPDGFGLWQAPAVSWLMLGTAVVVVTALGLAVAWVAARPPRGLVRRRLE